MSRKWCKIFFTRFLRVPIKRVFTSCQNDGDDNAFVIKTGSTTQWQADLAPKEMAASDMRNRRHVQPLLTWSTNAAHPVSLDPLQGTISRDRHTGLIEDSPQDYKRDRPVKVGNIQKKKKDY
ncbi:hypothetical protein LAZ67_7000762, partial [Cordylochernes scorpioides]